MANYHVWHHPDLDGQAASQTVDIEVPTLDGAGTETKSFGSLRNALAELRSQGADKGIADASVVDVGKSTNQRELWALKLGKGEKHKVLFTGCHHAREWISVEVPLLVAQFLVENYKDAPSNEREKRVKHLLQNRQIWFVPMVNPDGHTQTVQKDRMWRANTKEYSFPTETTIVAPQFGGGKPRNIRVKAGSNFRGVDINRNYPAKTWGQETRSRGRLTTSRDPADAASGIWAGPSAASEIETQRIVDLIRTHRFRASITYHSFSQLLLFPGAARKDAYVQEIGKGMSQLIDAQGNPYTYESGDALYPTTGDLMEFTYEAVPGRPTFTPELRPRDTGPASSYFSGLPESEIEPTFEENLGAALALINSAGFDAPAGPVKITWTPEMQFAQVVRSAWRVFEGFVP